jgi:hypothetical protein
MACQPGQPDDRRGDGRTVAGMSDLSQPSRRFQLNVRFSDRTCRQAIGLSFCRGRFHHRVVRSRPVCLHGFSTQHLPFYDFHWHLLEMRLGFPLGARLDHGRTVAGPA